MDAQLTQCPPARHSQSKLLRSGACQLFGLFCATLFSTFQASGQTTIFTYQGRLTANASPANGAYDLQFKLYDAKAVGTGTQQGTSLTTNSVPVSNGVFTVELDFGFGVFAQGASRFLELGVKPAGSPAAYTTLSPRQGITAAPYATRASVAGSAELFSGQPASAFSTTTDLSSLQSTLQSQNIQLQNQVTQLRSDLAAITAGTGVWARQAGSVDDDSAAAIAVDSSGNVIVAGTFTGTIDFGGGPLESAGGLDIFVAKFSGTTGAPIWSRRYGSNNYEGILSMCLDSAGNILIAGEFEGETAFGTNTLVAAGGSDSFLVKLSGTNGTHLWSRGIGTSGFNRPVSVAVSPTGDLVITGVFDNLVNFGGVSLGSAGGGDLFVARYDGNSGALQWVKGFGNSGPDRGRGVTVDSGGNVLIVGTFSDSVDFGGGLLTSAGLLDGFVVKLAGGTGAHIWSRRVGGTGQDLCRNVLTDSSRNVVVTGYFYSPTVDFGGGALTNATSDGNSDLFMVKLDANGAFQWAKTYGGTGSEINLGANLDSAGNIVLSGIFNGATSLGGVFYNSAGEFDIFAAKYSGADGSPIWSRRFGGLGDEPGVRSALNADGDVFLAGSFRSVSLDFGLGSITNAGGSDVFITKLKK